MPVVPHRPVDIRDILENHPDTEQPTMSLREIGNEGFIRLRTEVSDHVEPIESPDSNVSVSTSDNRKRKSEDMLQTASAKCSKSESSKFIPPHMRPLPTTANNNVFAER